MIETFEVRQMIERALPGSQVEVEDMRGTGDHFDVVVTWKGFAGKSLVEQHRLVFASLEKEMDGRIHAVQLKTKAL